MMKRILLVLLVLLSATLVSSAGAQEKAYGPEVTPGGGTRSTSGVTHPKNASDAFAVGGTDSSAKLFFDPATGILDINVAGGGFTATPADPSAGTNAATFDKNTVIPSAPAVGQIKLFELMDDGGAYGTTLWQRGPYGTLPTVQGPVCNSFVIQEPTATWAASTLYPWATPAIANKTYALPGASPPYTMDAGSVEVTSIACTALGGGTLRFDARFCNNAGSCSGLPGTRIASDQTCTSTPSVMTLATGAGGATDPASYPWYRLDDFVETGTVDQLYMTVCYSR